MLPTSHFPSGRSCFLVIQLARFGDLLQTKRLILSLLQEGVVHLVVDHSLAALARLIYPQCTVHGLAAHGRSKTLVSSQILADLAPLSKLDLARVYNLNFSGLNFALSTMFPADKVRGYRQSQGQRLMDLWPNLVMRWTRRRAEAGLNLVDIWGLYADFPVDPSMVNPKPCPRGKGLGVVMAGQNARRSLPPQVLAPLVQAALGRVGHGPIYLLGSGGERRAALELTSLLPPAIRSMVHNLVGKTTWPALVDAVTSLDLVLAPDTGTLHLAAHLGVPVMAFFLSSAWCHETGPYGQGHTVLQGVPECAPCIEAAPCAHQVRCLQFFSAPAVLRFVSGKEASVMPEGFALMRSDFDELGLVYRPQAGTDPCQRQRACLRNMAAGVAGLGPVGGCASADGAVHFFQERDWKTWIR